MINLKMRSVFEQDGMYMKIRNNFMFRITLRNILRLLLQTVTILCLIPL